MSGESASVSILAQNSGAKPYLCERINTLLKAPGLKRFRAAVAYASWNGLGLIAPRIEALLKAGGEFQAIYGVANGVTTPDSLLYSLYLQELYATHSYAGGVEDQYVNATFHPKFLEFRFASRTIAIIGSGNLTGGGLSRNTELGAEITIKHGGSLEKQLESAWQTMRAISQPLDLKMIRAAKVKGGLGTEQQQTETRASKSEKPPLKTGAQVSPKPLFSKVLDLKPPAKKSKILAKLDTLTVQPSKLYLQILSGETGAQASGGVGYQIQLPVATLATFFGVGAAQTKLATFRFGSDEYKVHLTHFGNNTHRVRLRPLREVSRPAIVVFERLGADEYSCSVVPAKDYAKVLAAKCTEQTRAGARRWGLE